MEKVSDPEVTIFEGDCNTLLDRMQPKSVDTTIADPPYELKFARQHGLNWDDELPLRATWSKILRVMKPGSLLFANSSFRQDLFAKMVYEMAHAELDDGTKLILAHMPIVWAFSKGMSKASDLTRAIDKHLGFDPIILRRNRNSRETCTKKNTTYRDGRVGKTAYVTAPVSTEAKSLEGLMSGYQPRPAIEAIIVAMRPTEDGNTFVEQAIANGHGGTFLQRGQIYDRDFTNGEGTHYRDAANLYVSDQALNDNPCDPEFSTKFDLDQWLAERCQFIIAPKVPENEKWFYCHKCEQAYGKDQLKFHYDHEIYCEDCHTYGNVKAHADHKYADVVEFHPTQKPIDLVNNIIQITTKPSALFPKWTVLDPYCGTGTVPLSAYLNGCSAIGFEQNSVYATIARARIAYYRNTRYVQRSLSIKRTNQGTLGDY